MGNQERTVMFQMPSVLAGNLACVEGTVKGRSFELTAGTFVIGRLDNSDLHLPNEPGVSKTHAKIIAEGDRYVLVDCESRNGTIVNGAPVQRKVLEDGDEIRVCGCVLRFTQRGATATGIKVRSLDSQRAAQSLDMSVEDMPVDMTDPGGDAVQATAMASAVSQPSISSSSPSPYLPPQPQVAQSSLPRTELEIPTFAPPSHSALAASAPPPPSATKTLAGWYAGGLLSALLFGGSASAVIVSTAAPEELTVAADAGPAGDDAVASADGGAQLAAAATNATDAAPGDAKAGGDAGPATQAEAANGDAAKAEAERLAAEQAAAEAKAAEAKAAEAKAEEAKAEEAKAAEAKANEERLAAAEAAKEREPARERRRREREASTPSETDAAATADAPSGKQFSATPESSRADTLKARGGKVKTVEAKDGDTVSKGQVLVTFEEGASEGEIMSLKDRIAALEAADSDEARADLKAARAKLEALTSGAKSPPVVASMAGVLSGFSVQVGEVLKSNATVGRIAEAGAPKRVRVRIDRGTRASRGQSVTLITKSGERSGSVASVSGRTVVVDTGDTAAADVEAVRF